MARGTSQQSIPGVKINIRITVSASLCMCTLYVWVHLFIDMYFICVPSFSLYKSFIRWILEGVMNLPGYLAELPKLCLGGGEHFVGGTIEG